MPGSKYFEILDTDCVSVSLESIWHPGYDKGTSVLERDRYLYFRLLISRHGCIDLNDPETHRPQPLTHLYLCLHSISYTLHLSYLASNTITVGFSLFHLLINCIFHRIYVYAMSKKFILFLIYLLCCLTFPARSKAYTYNQSPN